jgi:hypothetical protein
MLPGVGGFDPRLVERTRARENVFCQISSEIHRKYFARYFVVVFLDQQAVPILPFHCRPPRFATLYISSSAN